MRVVLSVILLFAAACESGCSGGENVRCRGVYRHGDQDNETSSKAVLGFTVQRVPFWATLWARKDDKGFVNFSYVSDPYAYASNSGGEILDITSDDGGSVSAGKSEKNRAQLLFYDHVDGVAKYYDSQNNIEKSFFGICQQEQ